MAGREKETMKWHKFDPTDFLDSEQAIADFLAETKQTGNKKAVALAQTEAARARERYHLSAQPTKQSWRLMLHSVFDKAPVWRWRWA